MRQNKTMKLIGSLTSPYVRKVRIVMAEKKLDFQLVLEDVWNSDDILRANPLGKVPCLVMEGGEAVFDSRVIVEYLDTLSPVGRLIPPSGRARAEVRTWEALADGLLDASIGARMEAIWGGRTEAQRSQAWISRQMSRVDSALSAMSSGLADRTWCHGNQMSLPTSPWAAPWATWTSATRRSTGVAATATWRACGSVWPLGPRSPRLRHPPESLARVSPQARLQRSADEACQKRPKIS